MPPRRPAQAGRSGKPAPERSDRRQRPAPHRARPRGRCALRDRHRPDVSGRGQVRRSEHRRSSGQPDDDAGSSVGCGRNHFPDRTVTPERPRTRGVTEERLLRRKTAGFLGVAPRILCGAICSRSLMPNTRWRLPGRRFPTRRPRTEGVISAVIRQPGCNHTLARQIDRRRSFQTAA